MARKINIGKSNIKIKKNGFNGNEMWEAHKLEGVVKNKSLKAVKKKKKIKIKV